MPRYRSNLSERELNFSDSGGPIVGPGEEFEHVIPTDQLASLLQSGFISEMVTVQIQAMKNGEPLGERFTIEREVKREPGGQRFGFSRLTEAT